MIPETRYTKSGYLNIAYQVVGDGPLDIVLVPGWVSNIDLFWEEPNFARFLRRLASFARVILFDKRGTGLSDRVTDSSTLEERMSDVRAVMDAVGSERAALVGYSEGGPMSALFAATYPERTVGLVMIGSYARMVRTEGYPYGYRQKQMDAFLEYVLEEWGTPLDLDRRAPSMRADPKFREWWARYLRSSASPQGGWAITRDASEIDIRHVLPTVNVPTLVIHATRDKTIRLASGRYLADNIPGATFVEIDTDDHLPWVDGSDVILDNIEEFLTGAKPVMEFDRVLATIMFTDIVGSTELAAKSGDRKWRGLLDAHHAAVRHELSAFQGREINTTGDGFVASFDGPARAIHCARAVRKAVQQIGVDLRIGLHTGECEMHGDDVSGLAVHIAARVSDLAPPGSVVTSRTVKDLVAGSGIVFNDFGTYQLKGVPDDWHLYSVEA